MENTGRASAAYALTVRLKIKNRPGNLARVMTKLAELKASMSELSLISSDFDFNVRDLTINCISCEHQQEVLQALRQIDVIVLEDWHDDVLKMHIGGKLHVTPAIELKTREELSQAYTPGVARICKIIEETPDELFHYTIKGKTVAIVTDGSAVLGLGNIGSAAGLPVMEGKAMLFKQFANIDAFPICLNTQDTDEIVKAVKLIAPVFGGINLEDISSPRCFEVEERLRKELDIPVFHDDQHGTACVVLAGLLNAIKITGKTLSNLRVAVSGYGASGVACVKMMLKAGVGNIVPCDSQGIVHRGRKDLNNQKRDLLKVTNLHNETGTLSDAVKGADVFLGVSKPGVLTREMVKSMAKDPVIFALANPDPEILPEQVDGIARIIATGRSDYANQINNVLCFPGVFLGALQCRARDITENMKLAAAKSIAAALPENELREDNIIPSVFDRNVAPLVGEAVRKAAIQDGVSRIG